MIVSGVGEVYVVLSCVLCIFECWIWIIVDGEVMMVDVLKGRIVNCCFDMLCEEMDFVVKWFVEVGYVMVFVVNVICEGIGILVVKVIVLGMLFWVEYWFFGGYDEFEMLDVIWVWFLNIKIKKWWVGMLELRFM